MSALAVLIARRRSSWGKNDAFDFYSNDSIRMKKLLMMEDIEFTKSNETGNNQAKVTSNNASDLINQSKQKVQQVHSERHEFLLSKSIHVLFWMTWCIQVWPVTKMYHLILWMT
mmetsp:Transcript_31991/g.54597  ORF Transcript_31991/g.54597 Transcript_31991/m.54597 type:complete len:114 (+) Transcript_31991:426-767(+)